jgi:hypothetical protein
MTRSIGIMDKATIDKIAEVATNDMIRLHHYGESLLYPELCEYAIKTFASKGIKTGINTNGTAANLKNINRVMDAGLAELVLSYHPLYKRKNANEAASTKHIDNVLDNIKPEYLQRMEMIRVVSPEEEKQAVEEMKEYAAKGLKCQVKRLRNLGKVFGENNENFIPKCSFLDNTEFCVLWDGSIVSCCEVYDARPEWIIGNINDQQLPSINRGCSLCKGCPGYGNSEEETEKEQIVC